MNVIIRGIASIENSNERYYKWERQVISTQISYFLSLSFQTLKLKAREGIIQNSNEYDY